MPGLGALVAGLGALGAIDFLAAAGVDVPRVAVRDSDGAEGAADADAGAAGASGIGGRSAIAARRGINGSLRSLATSFTKSGRTSPLFLVLRGSAWFHMVGNGLQEWKENETTSFRL